MSKYIIYGSPNCIFCKKAIELLQRVDVEFEYRDISKNDEWKNFLVENGFRTVPQIYSPSGRHIGGYEDLTTEI